MSFLYVVCMVHGVRTEKWAESWLPCEFVWFFKAFQCTFYKHSICKENLKLILSSPFLLPSYSHPELYSSVEKPGSKTDKGIFFLLHE